MAKKKALVQENKAEITGSPVTTAKPVLARTIQVKATTSSANDPIWDRLERQELNGTPYIDSSGRGLLRYRNPAYEINDIYASDGDKKKEGNIITGLTEAQANFLCFHQTHYPNNSAIPSYEQFAITMPAGYRAGHTLKGLNGTSYTAILDRNGEAAYFDTGKSCVMTSAIIGATLPAARNDDLIDEAQRFIIKYNVDKNGKITEKTAEQAAIALTLARIENKATKLPLQLDMIERITSEVALDASQKTYPKGGIFSSSVDAGIKSENRPSTPFETAIFGVTKPDPSRSIMFQPKETSNDPAFKLKA